MMLHLLCLLAFRSGPGASSHTSQTKRIVYQIGTFEALSLGRYDGIKPISLLLQHGDLGVGTFNGLDGEMIVVDGKIYHGNAFGDLDFLPPSTTTPFACVVPFKADFKIQIEMPTTSGELKALIDRKIGRQNKMLAIRIDGQFSNLTTRAFPPQFKPYIPFAKLASAPTAFYTSVNGTFVGYRLPKSVGLSNVPGYHFHFVNNQRNRGGHILSYGLASGSVQVMLIDKVKAVQ